MSLNCDILDPTSKFKTYLDSFETQVVIKGFEKEMFGKVGKVTVKDCKLCNTPFGQFIGRVIEYGCPMVVDYYGYIRKSSGMIQLINGYKGIEIKTILVPVVHFASIKNEHIAELAPELLEGFQEFKGHLIKLRGFRIT